MTEETIVFLINIVVIIAIIIWVFYDPKEDRVKKPEKKMECKEQLNYVRLVIRKMQYQIDVAEHAHEPVDSTDWWEQIGILITREDAEAIVNYFYTKEEDETTTS